MPTAEFGSLTNYHCCGVDLADLHDLQRHIDEVHTSWPPPPYDPARAKAAGGAGIASAHMAVPAAYSDESAHHQNPSNVHLRHPNSGSFSLGFASPHGVHGNGVERMVTDDAAKTLPSSSSESEPSPATGEPSLGGGRVGASQGAAHGGDASQFYLGSATLTPPKDDSNLVSASSEAESTATAWLPTMSVPLLEPMEMLQALANVSMVPETYAPAASTASSGSRARKSMVGSVTARGSPKSKGSKRRRFSDSFIPLSPPASMPSTPPAAGSAWWTGAQRGASSGTLNVDSGKPPADWLSLSPASGRKTAQLRRSTSTTSHAPVPPTAGTGTGTGADGATRAPPSARAPSAMARPAVPSATVSRSRSFDQSMRNLQFKTGRSPSLPSLSLAFAPGTAATSVEESFEGSSAPSSPDYSHEDVSDQWTAFVGDDHLGLSTDRISTLSLDGVDAPAAAAAGTTAATAAGYDDKPYRCLVPGCGKAYKNANGLKYHSYHGHPNNSQSIAKPYLCPVPGCGKAYKNANGLKYHCTHVHGPSAAAIFGNAM